MADCAVQISARLKHIVFLIKPWITRNLKYRQSLACSHPRFYSLSQRTAGECLTQRGHFLSTQFRQHLLSTYCVLGSVLGTLGTSLSLLWEKHSFLEYPLLGSPAGGTEVKQIVAHLRGRASTANPMYALLLPIFLKVLLEWTFPIPLFLLPILTVEL